MGTDTVVHGVFTESEMIDRIIALSKAGRNLRNNVSGIWERYETQLREIVGHTNYTVVADAIREYDAADESTR